LEAPTFAEWCIVLILLDPVTGPLSGSGPIVLVSSGGTTLPAPVTTTTIPSLESTIYGGPNATSDMVGTKNDPADFYGILLALVAIALAIVLTRYVFRRPGGSDQVEGPR
jgi:hypothetical protein